ncbi:hypothetical protein Wcon_01562 [Wolbachia endosymbiont of Cylisticus convexus]|nr:hypothetical protein Wcon_02081 [Wolbachia endosymbiont of Cylisticus convexus]RDD34029.1 hypothetical protein Wcon_01939 [Wolbachia endosymbiont of Cylisticus convexus]RDD34048.1 hypothetical protein Wcon_01911 [Wolbachia endosymbiont of Cylisticus convexus]RDD34356.1 hypothetical protein Wcon_01562 [Wolbachia endosymbiont of Cylisticus convexus]
MCLLGGSIINFPNLTSKHAVLFGLLSLAGISISIVPMLEKSSTNFHNFCLSLENLDFLFISRSLEALTKTAELRLRASSKNS